MRWYSTLSASVLLCGLAAGCSESDGLLQNPGVSPTPVVTPTPVVSTTSAVLQAARQSSEIAEPFSVNDGAFGFNDTAEDTQPLAVNTTP